MSATLDPLIVRLATGALPLVLFAVIGLVMILRRRRITPLASLTTAPDGTMTIPVRALYRRDHGLMGAKTHNSINPRFAITPDGFDFRVLRTSHLPFSGIGHADVREWFGGTYVLFVNTAQPRVLSANVGDRATAKQVLDALPRAIALTPEAATVRDGRPDAGMPGLNRYRGRLS